MGLAEYGQYDALGLAALVERGDVHPRELVEAAIDQIERHNPAINAVTFERFDRARAAAERPLPRGPFAGVPYLLKDMTPHAGSPLTLGVAFLRRMRYVSPESHPVVSRSEQAGLIVRMPDWWNTSRRPRPKVSVSVGAKAPSALGMDALLDFDVKLTIDGKSLSRKEIEELTAQREHAEERHRVRRDAGRDGEQADLRCRVEAEAEEQAERVHVPRLRDEAEQPADEEPVHEAAVVQPLLQPLAQPGTDIGQQGAHLFDLHVHCIAALHQHAGDRLALAYPARNQFIQR